MMLSSSLLAVLLSVFHFNVAVAGRGGVSGAGGGPGTQTAAPPRTDVAGGTHERYQFTVNGVPVFGRHEVVHHDCNGNERIHDDPLPKDIDQLDTTPTVQGSAAIQIASDYLTADHTGTIEFIDNELNILIIEKAAYLAWKAFFKMYDEDGILVSMPLVFVHAHDPAEMLKKYETFTGFALEDADKITYIYGTSTVGDSSNSLLLNIHDHSQTVLDVLMSEVGYDSFDNAGAQIQNWGDYAGLVNAYYDGK